MNISSAINGAVRFGKNLVNKAREVLRPAADFVADNVKPIVATGCAMFGLSAMADTTGAPDASSIVSTATTTFNSVGTLVAAAVGFFIIVKIVKWVRK